MKITIMSQDNAIKYSKETSNNILIVSITSNINEKVNFEGNNIHNIFRMYFNDIEYDIGLYKAPSKNDFMGLKNFLDKNLNDSIDEVVVHCHAGISRSSACASAITRYLKMDDTNIWRSDKYIPNKLVYILSLNELGINISDEELISLYDMNYKAHEFDFDLEDDFFI